VSCSARRTASTAGAAALVLRVALKIVRWSRSSRRRRPDVVVPGHLGPLTGPDVVTQLKAAAAPLSTLGLLACVGAACLMLA